MATVEARGERELRPTCEDKFRTRGTTDLWSLAVDVFSGDRINSIRLSLHAW
jgi:hypothetical protein